MFYGLSVAKSTCILVERYDMYKQLESSPRATRPSLPMVKPTNKVMTMHI